MPRTLSLLARLAALLLVCGALAASLVRAKEPSALEQDYAPAPAIWRVADEDTTIYLFGTIHLLPPGFRWRSPPFDAIVDEADELVLESSSEDAMTSLAAYESKYGKIGEARAPTSQQLAPAVRGKWRALIESSGAWFDEVDVLPLPLMAMGLGYTTGGEPGLSRPELGVESVLEAEFMAAGKPVGSIEDHGAVLLSLMRIDERALIGELEADLAHWNGKSPKNYDGAGAFLYEPETFQMEHDWARGVVGKEFDLGLGHGKLAAAFDNVLLARRNRAWAGWLDARLERPGTVLVAVGAGHFEGPRSVLAMLEARGLRVERIE
ncbi:TraB/GumN family protein [Aurantiacibacter suaedae]|uniref:TraB/GumN family protein n=1 Tax=Aurantiacibacter suaedae TaxID=2545755 RepID=UPI001387400E|nr:TraB/GumN family protein [Aurantiacibacter suaedae]